MSTATVYFPESAGSVSEAAKKNGPAHPHPAQAVCRAASESGFFGKFAAKFSGKQLLGLGNGDRELSTMQRHGLKLAHNCRCDKHSHDYDHFSPTGYCTGYETCVHPADFLFATDFAYYTTAEEIAGLLSRHGAEAAYFNVHRPFVGGAGTRYDGEMRWERTDGDQVAVSVDTHTEEVWRHSDMGWLRGRTCKRVGDRWLVWGAAYSAGGRVVYRFALEDHEVHGECAPMPTLRGWLSGEMMPEFDGPEPVCFTAHQLAAAVGFDVTGLANSVVEVRAINAAVGHIEGRARAYVLTGNDVDWSKVDATLRLRLSTLKVPGQSVGAVAGFCNQLLRASEAWGRQAAVEVDTHAERTARAIVWAARKRSIVRFFFWVVRAGGAAAIIATMRYSPGSFVAAAFSCGLGWLIRRLFARTRLGRWCASPTGAKSVEYPEKPVTIKPTCVPFVGTITNSNGTLTVDDCPCTKDGADMPSARYALYGISAHPESIVTHCTCVKCLGSAFSMRVYAHEHKATADKEAEDFIRGMPGLLGITRPFPLNCADFEEWRARLNPNARAKMLVHAQMGRPVSDVGQPIQLDAFVKTELSVKPGPDTMAALPGKPRHIIPNDDAHRVVVGPTAYASSHVAKQVFHPGSTVVYGSGLTSEQLGNVYDSAHASGMTEDRSTDFGAFDTTNRLTTGQRVALAFMFLTGSHPDALRYDYGSRHNRVTRSARRGVLGGDCHAKQVNPGTTSGHDHTTGGNTAFHALLHLWVQGRLYCDAWLLPERVTVGLLTGVPLDAAKGSKCKLVDETLVLLGMRPERGSPYVHLPNKDLVPVRVIVCGDDGLIMARPDEAERYMRCFADLTDRLGYNLEQGPHAGVHDTEVCSSLPWPAERDGKRGTLFGPKPGKIIVKTGFKRASEAGRGGIRARGMLLGDALGLQNTCAHVPILRSYVAKLIQLNRGVTVVNAPDEKYKIRVSGGPANACEAGYQMASDRYGLPRAVIAELEEQIMSITRLPAILHHPAWEVVIRRDN